MLRINDTKTRLSLVCLCLIVHNIAFEAYTLDYEEATKGSYKNIKRTTVHSGAIASHPAMI